MKLLGNCWAVWIGESRSRREANIQRRQFVLERVGIEKEKRWLEERKAARSVYANEIALDRCRVLGVVDRSEY